MPKFRIEARDTRVTVRETWIEADTLADAVAEAESQDWREWSEQDAYTESGLTVAEDEHGNTHDLPL